MVIQMFGGRQMNLLDHMENSALGINQYCYAGKNLPNLVAQYIEVAAPDQYDQIFFQGGEI